MKRITPLFIAAILGFVSCNSNETVTLNEKLNENLLNAYTLSRDADGTFSLDFSVNPNTSLTTFKGENDSNDIVLTSVRTETPNSYSNDFVMNNDELRFDIMDDGARKKTNIFVEDDNIKLARGTSVTQFLNSYNITSNNDGTYKLDFNINTNVTTSFNYNEETNVYEVHLSEGNSLETNFSRDLEMPSAGLLKIYFVNHINNQGARSAEKKPIKPKIIISEPEDYPEVD